MANVYSPEENYRNVKRRDIPIAVGQDSENMKRGRWIQKDASGNAVKAESGVAQAGGASVTGMAVYPIMSGMEQPDSETTKNVTVGRMGTHLVRTDEYWVPSDGRPAWTVNAAFVVLDGKPTTFLAARDAVNAIRGHCDEVNTAQNQLRLIVY